MFFTRFRAFREVTLFFCLFAGLIFWQGCGGNDGASSSKSTEQPSMAAQAAESERPETGEMVGGEATDSPSESQAGLQEPVAETGPGDLQTTLAQPLSIQEETRPAMPAGGVELDAPLPQPAVAEPNAPIGSGDVFSSPQEGAPPTTMAQDAPSRANTSPFSENPLREGTDEFPGRPANPRVPDATGGGAAMVETPFDRLPETSAGSVGKKGKSDAEHYDPVAENGEIFVGWQKPKVALLISGRQDGYLEPCGCAGLHRMKGGLTRRHSLFKELSASGWPVVGIDCGGLVKGSGRQAELKFNLSVDAMQKIGYSAIALGKSDLRLPAAELLSRVASSPGAPSPFLSANVAVYGFDAGMTTDHRIVEAGGLRIGITSVLGTAWQKEISPDIEMAEPQAKLQEVLPKLKDRCDLLVLLAHATVEESKAYAAAFPEFQIVVTAGGNPQPPMTMEILPGGTRFIEVGEKGMDAIVLGVYDGGKIEYQRVPLDSRFADSPDMKEYMRQYQQQLKRDGLAVLGIRPVPHAQAAELGKFVGSKKCKDCHEPSYDVWKKSGHAKAWKTLVELEVPRTHDPECISCHVIGWHPTEYFPYESGFLSEEETPELIDVGCENCHGAGEKHVEAEMGADAELQKKLQQALRVTKEQSQSDKNRWCLNCHDLDNSPDFNFEEYWPKVEHSEDIWEDEKK